VGTDPKAFAEKHPNYRIIHAPLIRIEPKSVTDFELQQAYAKWSCYTHLIVTSKQAVYVLFDHLKTQQIEELDKTWIAVGEITAQHLVERGIKVAHVAVPETQEGIIALLETLDLQQSTLFCPQSSLSRPLLESFLQSKAIAYQATILYNTHFVKPVFEPNWECIDEIVFTSPSTVSAFIQIFGKIPSDKVCTPIGPITAQALTLNT
jgi:uroporphyrinogen-III synthase